MRVTDTKSFIEKSIKVHGNIYDYRNCTYEGYDKYIKIICKEHGEFSQVASAHLRGREGCKECTKKKIVENRAMSKQEFIERSNHIHGHSYDYSESDYYGYGKPVKIICPKHGPFKIRREKHLSGTGCQKCRGTKTSLDDWLNIFKEAHGDKYDYSNADYISSKGKIEIICPDHGSFWTIPRNHALSKFSCKKCSIDATRDILSYGLKGMYGTKRPSNFYIFKLREGLIKIGLSVCIKDRIMEIKREANVSPTILYDTHGKAVDLFKMEQHILFESGIPRAKHELDFSGHTECFDEKYLDNIISIVENWDHTNEEELSNEISQTNDG